VVALAEQIAGRLLPLLVEVLGYTRGVARLQAEPPAAAIAAVVKAALVQPLGLEARIRVDPPRAQLVATLPGGEVVAIGPDDASIVAGVIASSIVVDGK
jgi:hypothetical protein